jgi:drug/metabolite transporter (DMT)-like permease
MQANTNAKIAFGAYTKTPFFIVMMFSGFWALQIFVTKLGFNAGAQVLSFQTISILTALVLLAFLTIPKFGPDFKNLFTQKPVLFWKLFFANGIQSGLGTWLSIIGISMTAAINAGFLVKLATVTTILFASLILNERLTALKIFTVIAMLSGAYLLTTKGQVLLPQVGDLFILSACVCWSFGNVLVRKFLKTETIKVEVVTFQKPIAGLPVILLFIMISAWHPEILQALQGSGSCCSPTLASLPFALLNGICLAFTWTYLNRTLKVSSASYMTMMSMVTPVFVSILAMIFLGETLVLVQVAGIVLILSSGVVTYFSGIARE